jgi:Ran GTPase-activating protein (RanGAP) involved in mRNA processing and transport
MSENTMTTADVLKALQAGESVDNSAIVAALKQKSSRQAADVVQQFGEHESKTLLVPKSLDNQLQSAIKQAGFPNQKAASYTMAIDFIDRVEKGATIADFLADASMIGVNDEDETDISDEDETDINDEDETDITDEDETDVEGLIEDEDEDEDEDEEFSN